MIAFICLFVPPLVWLLTREQVFKNHISTARSAINYAIFTLVFTGAMLFVLYYIIGNHGALSVVLNTYSDFAIKYIIMSLAFAIGEPYLEKYLREKVEFSVQLPKARPRLTHVGTLTVIYALFLFGLNFIRIFDSNLWADETFSALLVHGSFSEIISKTAADVHPPLYYIFLKLGYELAGDQGWMYHLVSLIPFAIVLIVSVTFVRKQFGTATALILMTIAGLSSNAEKFNVEVRMYSWGALFVLFSFVSLYKVLHGERAKSYVGFVVFSLAAAFTHYYCLVSVAFFYVLLLFLAFVKKRLSVKKVMAVCVFTVIVYLPWLVCVLTSLAGITSNYWITSVPTLSESISYLFSDQFSSTAWICICICLVIVVTYETGILSYETNGEKHFKINLKFTGLEISRDLYWIIGGLLSIFGSILLAICLSNVYHPVYLLRYIYPVSIVAWILLGYIVSKLKTGRIVAAIVVVCMLVTFLPDYMDTYAVEKAENESLASTLEATLDLIGEDDAIITNSSHFVWKVLEYYYGNTNSTLINANDMCELDTNTDYWLIVAFEYWVEYTTVAVEEQGFVLEQIVDDGIIGTVPVYIYHATYDAAD